MNTEAQYMNKGSAVHGYEEVQYKATSTLIQRDTSYSVYANNYFYSYLG